MLPDDHDESLGLVRIIDEDTSEVDGYLYPAAMFAAIELPKIAEQVLMA